MANRFARPVVLGWESFKDWLSPLVHLTHHQLHILLGILLFLAFSRLLRVPLTSFLPLLPVAGLEVLNEVSDYIRYRIDGWPWGPWPTLYDIILTLGPPLALALSTRLFRASGWTINR